MSLKSTYQLELDIPVLEHVHPLHVHRHQAPPAAYSSQFKNNYFTEMCSGSEAGSYLIKAHRLCESLNSRLESNKVEEEDLHQAPPAAFRD